MLSLHLPSTNSKRTENCKIGSGARGLCASVSVYLWYMLRTKNAFSCLHLISTNLLNGKLINGAQNREHVPANDAINYPLRRRWKQIWPCCCCSGSSNDVITTTTLYFIHCVFEGSLVWLFQRYEAPLWYIDSHTHLIYNETILLQTNKKKKITFLHSLNRFNLFSIHVSTN